MDLSVTLVFVAILALIQVPMTAMVGFYRAKTGIELLDGGNLALLRRIRAHGNFTENVPIALLAMAAAELSGAPGIWLWGGGAVLVVGRLLHCSGMLGWPTTAGRGIGMALTLIPIAGFAILTLMLQIGMMRS